MNPIASPKKRIILSGMRPTGKLHLGNWMGALSTWVRLQQEPDTQCYYMVADWHALTTDYENTERIETNIEEMVLDWLAAGIDPQKSVIFRQSWVGAHAELALILSMITPISWLERNPTYKDQLNELKDRDIATHGFLGYPVLQAADILLYRATHVPVGEDQLPHVELTREIARRFNHLFSRDGNNIQLTEVQALLSSTPKVPGLDARKMSKSYNNCIDVAEDSEILRKKIFSMFTDPLKIKATDAGHPEPCEKNPSGCVVYAFHKIFKEDSGGLIRRAQSCMDGTLGCVACKKDLFARMENQILPQREERKKFSQKNKIVQEILEAGSRQADAMAQSTLDGVRKAIHFNVNPF